MLCEGCLKQITVKMTCPKCNSFFCSQECFKKNWNDHKKKHITTRQLLIVPDNIQKPDYYIDGIPKSEISVSRNTAIKVLSDEEISKMRTVCKMAREVLDTVAKSLRVGITTDEINKIAHKEIIKRGAYPSPLNYYNFPKSICTSVNEVICHGIPNNRELKNGDIINLDVTLFYDGFHGDLNETYCIGDVDNESRRLISCAKRCLDEAIKICKPGTRYREIGNVIQKIADEAGFSVVRSYGGHGIHRLFHTAPQIPHYANSKAIGVMRPGHVFTIEPMINAGDWKDHVLPDKWTVITNDNKRSAQFEETLLITHDGVEILTKKEDNFV